MKITIDTVQRSLEVTDETGIRHLPLYSRESFELLSDQWLKVGWNEKYPYTFSWMGIPIIQLPEDIVRMQEVIYRVKPDVIVETGVAHGGSLIFYASLFKAMGHGRVIGVDIEIRAHNRKAIESHPLSPAITLIEGSSIDPDIVHRVKSLVHSGEKVLVILDSNHLKAHVLAELESYHSLVTTDSYIVATDGMMKDLHDVPLGKADWREDNPVAAVLEFVASHPEFSIESPQWGFNESGLSKTITHWPSAWLKKN